MEWSLGSNNTNDTETYKCLARFLFYTIDRKQDTTLLHIKLMYSFRCGFEMIFCISLFFLLVKIFLDYKHRASLDTLTYYISLFYGLDIFFKMIQDIINLRQIHNTAFSNMLYLGVLCQRLSRMF